VAVALAEARGDDREEMRRQLGGSGLDGDDLDTMREIIERVGARARIEAMIEERAALARAALAAERLPSPVAEALDDLASSLTNREH